MHVAQQHAAAFTRPGQRRTQGGFAQTLAACTPGSGQQRGIIRHMIASLFGNRFMNRADFSSKSVTEDLVLGAGTCEIERVDANTLMGQRSHYATRIETATQVSYRRPVVPDTTRHRGLKAFVNFGQMTWF